MDENQRKAMELARDTLGRTWKRKLKDAWFDGKEQAIADETAYRLGAAMPFSANDMRAYLRQVRNCHGSRAFAMMGD